MCVSFIFLQFVDLLPNLVSCLRHPYCAVRHMAARSVGALSKAAPVKTMQVVIQQVISLLGTGDVLEDRQGAIECITSILLTKYMEH